MSYYDGFRPTYTFHQCVKRDDGTVMMDMEITATDKQEEIEAAKRMFHLMLDGFVPSLQKDAPAPVPAPAEKPVAPVPEAENAAQPDVLGTVAETAAMLEQQDQAERTGFKTGIKGLVKLECPECGNVFATWLSDYEESTACKCGHVIDLTNPTLARYERTCPTCGKLAYGWTNIEGPEFMDRCVCGKALTLKWDKARKRYTN